MAEVTIDTAALALIDAVEEAIGPWVSQAVARRHPGPLPDEVIEAAHQAGLQARAEVGERLRQLLALDIDDQWTNPLSVIRTVVRYPTQVLAVAGVPPIDRDRESTGLNPDDVYDLVPAAFADLGPEVHEPGLVWGAAKAHLHLHRRRDEERRRQEETT